MRNLTTNQIVSSEEVINKIEIAREAYNRTKEANNLLAAMINDSRKMLANQRDCIAYSKGLVHTVRMSTPAE